MFDGVFEFLEWVIAVAVAVVVGLIAGIVCREWIPSLAWAVAALWGMRLLINMGKGLWLKPKINPLVCRIT